MPLPAVPASQSPMIVTMPTLPARSVPPVWRSLCLEMRRRENHGSSVPTRSIGTRPSIWRYWPRASTSSLPRLPRNPAWCNSNGMRPIRHSSTADSQEACNGRDRRERWRDVCLGNRESGQGVLYLCPESLSDAA